MISFRYHIVSIVSVFLALAVGVALGGGPLKGEVDNSLVKELAARKHELATQRSEIAALKSTAGFYDGYASTTAATVLGNKLEGRTVAFISLPGADRAVETKLGQLVSTAGGEVTGSYAMGAKLGQAANRQLVDELGNQMAAAAPDVKIAADASGYQRLGALIGRAIGTTTPGGSAYDARSTGIMSSLSTAGLMRAEHNPAKRADVVVVIGGPASTTDAGTAANSIYGKVAGSIGGGVAGIVVAGPSTAARTGGLLRSVRDDVSLSKTVSTVDSTDTGAGRVVAVLALAQRAAGKVGAYGAVDADNGAMPGAAKP